MAAFSPPSAQAVNAPPASSGTSANLNRRSSDSNGHLLPQPPRSPYLASPTSAGPSPGGVSSNGTDFDETAADELVAEPAHRRLSQNGHNARHSTAPNGHATRTGEGTRSGAGAGVGLVAGAAARDRAFIHVETKTEGPGEALKPDSPEGRPTSTIHAPTGFIQFKQRSPSTFGRTTPTPSQTSDITVLSAQGVPKDRNSSQSPLSPPPIDTDVRPVSDPFETPRAQTRSEAEIEAKEKASRVREGSLEGIPENDGLEERTDDESGSAFLESAYDRMQRTPAEVAALKIALGECWTLCNTLAGLSSLHRRRTFRSAKSPDGCERAWKSCWQLCQKLYDERDGDVHEVSPILNLCRDFCQSLFEVRQKDSEIGDSVLRVSFELNNHLFNTQDRSLPEAFPERTLDFYITLCHRLMKQRNAMVEETDSLLRCCWSLAEMLFSLRQNRREGKPPSEELLGSAVQACWELCDRFREDWTQIRPDRGTPRPSSMSFTSSAFQDSGLNTHYDPSVATISITESSEDEYEDPSRLNPETPTTIFEDTNQVSPDDAPVPNILVLGPDASDRGHPPWSSTASTLSGYSSASSNRSSISQTNKHSDRFQPAPFHQQPTLHDNRHSLPEPPHSASTASTITNPGIGPGIDNPQDEARLACLKLLIVRAALAIGYERPGAPSRSNSAASTRSRTSTSSSSAAAGTHLPPNARSLQSFVKAAPSSSFGTAPWQARLLLQYKTLVADDAAFREAGVPARASAVDVARAVRWMVASGQYVWLTELFRWVLGFRVEEAGVADNVWVGT